MRTLCIFDTFQNLSVPSEMNRLLHFELKCPPVSDSNTLLSGFARPDTGQDKSSNEGHRIAPFSTQMQNKGHLSSFWRL